MFTTGSKLFLGTTAITVLTTLVFWVETTDSVFWTATIGLLGAVVAVVAVTAVNYFVRDANVSGMDTDAAVSSPAAQRRPGNSMWPAVTALGAGLLVVGLVSVPVVFKAGVVVLIASMIEWAIQGWSERASGDRAYNARVRGRLLHPLEFPVLAAAGLGVVVYSFSRIMLFVDKAAGPAIFAILAALVLVGGFLFASGATVAKTAMVGICTIGALGLVSTGAVMAIDGQRHIEEHPTISNDPAVCASNSETEVDERGSQGLAAKSNVSATIVFKDGSLYAQQIGMTELLTTITLPRSTPSNIVFRNLSDDDVRLTANLGAFPTDTIVNGSPTIDKPVTCTTLVEPDGRQFLTLNFPKSSAASNEPFTLTIPGSSAAVTVLVP